MTSPRKSLTPRPYQQKLITRAVERMTSGGAAGQGLFVGLGLGKTICSLEIFLALRRAGVVGRAMIVAPPRVCALTWPDELDRWSEYEGLSYSVLAGKTPKQRKELLMERRDICITTPDSVVWLAKEFDTPGKLRRLPYDFLIVDESTAFKTWGSKRSKAMRKLLPKIKRSVILSATPRPNGVLDLFSQIFLIDRGETLGKSVSRFKARFGYQGGFKGYVWTPHDWADEKVNESLVPQVLRLDTTDEIDMPPLIYNTIECSMPAKAKLDYSSLEKQLQLELANGDSLTPVNAGVRYLACKQFAGGAVYRNRDETGELLETRDCVRIHDAKLDLLEETLDCLQAPALVAYQYQWEADEISRRLKAAKLRFRLISGGTKKADARAAVSQWNEGKLDVLLAQPQGLSHGINLQHGPGRDIIWYGLTDQPEVFAQFNGRIFRPGVAGTVTVHLLAARGTVDAAIYRRLSDKAEAEKSMLDFLRDEYKRDSTL